MVDVRLGVSTKIASEPEAQLHAALERYDPSVAPNPRNSLTSTSTPPSARGAVGSPARRAAASPSRRRSCSSAAPRSTRPTSAATRTRARGDERAVRPSSCCCAGRRTRQRVGRDGKTADELCAHVGHAHLAARSRRRRPRRGAPRAKQSDVVVEWGPRIRAGAMVFQKTAFVHARRASEDGVLQTKEGEQRAYKAGDFVVHDASRGQYATDAESFVRRYDYEGAEEARTAAFADEGFLWCRPIGRIWAHRVTALEAERFFPTGSFQSAWGEMLTLNAEIIGDALPGRRRGVPDRRAHVRQVARAAARLRRPCLCAWLCTVWSMCLCMAAPTPRVQSRLDLAHHELVELLLVHRARRDAAAAAAAAVTPHFASSTASPQGHEGRELWAQSSPCLDPP